jgi:hypothetical protein
MRLLTSGCSYTRHCWSTWAEILGLSFDQFENLAYGGSDNASIARSIVNNARSGDTVVILWSGYDRWSFYSDKDHTTYSSDKLHWKHVGCLMSISKDFFVNYYHPVERFQTTMDYIQLVDLHSKINNYTVYHFSAFPFFLGEIEKEVNPHLVDIYKKYQISNNYLTDMSLDEFTSLKYPNRPIIKHVFNTGGDTHPLPTVHMEYVEKIIAPKIGIILNKEIFPSIIIEENNIINYGKLKHETQSQ